MKPKKNFYSVVLRFYGKHHQIQSDDFNLYSAGGKTLVLERKIMFIECEGVTIT